MEKYNIKGVEIFSTGEWNGEKFSQEHLNDLVKNFEATKSGVRPYLKLGHDKDQKLLQKDGLPAAGWVDKIYLKGDKLVADFVDIPKKVFQLIKAGAYKKVSCEMFFNVKIKEQKFAHLLTAVSLLGADTPAVMNLNDIHALYFGDEKHEPKCYELEFKFDEQGVNKMSKSENEIKLELELETKEAAFTAEKEKAEKLAKEKETLDKELEQLRQFKADAEKKAVEDAIKLREEQVKAFTTELVSEKLSTPAMKPLIAELLSDKKEFSHKIGDKELKSKEDLLKETLKLFAAAKEVNFEESTQDDKEAKKFAADKEKEQDGKIKKLMAEKKMSYKQAYNEIMKEKK
jgi:hypothetical protein